jgi:hypothetical protein
VDLRRDSPAGSLPQEYDQTGTGDQLSEAEVAKELRRLRVRAEAERQLRALCHGPAPQPSATPLSELLAEPDQPTRYLLDGLLPVGGRVVMAGPAKCSKSTVVGNLLRSLADSDPFLGRFRVSMPDGSAFLVDTEISRDTLRSWLRDQQIRHPDRISVESVRGRLDAFNIMDAPVLRQWATLLNGLGTRVLIVDCLRPLLDAAGLDEHRDAGRYLLTLDELAERAAVGELIVVHHMGHVGERSRGDSRLRDWPDAEWRLVRQGEDPASPRFFSAFGRDVDVPESQLDYDRATRHLTLVNGNRADAAAAGLIPDVLKIVQSNPTGISQNGIVNALKEQGKPEKAGREAVKQALSDQPGPALLRVAAGPRGAKLHTLTAAGAAVLNGDSKCPTNGGVK